MKIEDQVCSLEQAKRLKELGVDYKSVFQWRDFSMLKDNRIIPGLFMERITPSDASPMQVFNAFTVAELGEILCKVDYEAWGFKMFFTWFEQDDKKWNCGYRNAKKINRTINCDTEAQARAAMLIYLLENNLHAIENKNVK